MSKINKKYNCKFNKKMIVLKLTEKSFEHKL